MSKKEKKKVSVTYDISTTLEGKFEIPDNDDDDRDIWDVVYDYINSPEFAERLREAIINKKIVWELTL